MSLPHCLSRHIQQLWRRWGRSTTPKTLLRPGRDQGLGIDYGAKYPKAVAKIVDDADVLLEFYRYPAAHWVRLRTTNPIESSFATLRLRTKVTKGPG